MLSNLHSIHERLERLARRISPRTRAILVTSFAASVLVFALSVVRLFNVLRLEDRVESCAINHMKNYVGRSKLDGNMKIIVIPDKQQGAGPPGDSDKQQEVAPSGDSNRKHREFFVKLVTAMKNAKAKVLAFDVAFEGPFDKTFSESISSQSSDLKVIVGVFHYKDGKPKPELPTDVKEPRWGTFDVGGSQEDGGSIRSMKLAEESLRQNDSGSSELIVVPSFALRVVSELYNPPLVPVFDQGHLRLHLYSDASKSKIVKSVPLDRQTDLLMQQAEQQDLMDARVDAQAIYDNLENSDALRDFKGKIVLVGYENGELREVLSGGHRLGVELHATAISNILNDIFIYKLSPLHNYLMILFMALIPGILYTPWGKRFDYKIPIPIPKTGLTLPIPLAWFVLVGVYLLVAFIVYKKTRVYLDVCYHIAALTVSYALVWFVLKKKFPPQSKLETLE